MVNTYRLARQLAEDQSDWAVYLRYDGPLYRHMLCLDENGEVYLYSRHRDENGIPMLVWHGRDREYTIPGSVDLYEMGGAFEEIAKLCRRIHKGLTVTWDGHNNVGSLDKDALEAEETLRELLIDVNSRHHYETANEEWYANVVPDVARRVHAGELTRDNAINELICPVEEGDVTILPNYDAVDVLDAELEKLNETSA